MRQAGVAGSVEWEQLKRYIGRGNCYILRLYLKIRYGAFAQLVIHSVYIYSMSMT